MKSSKVKLVKTDCNSDFTAGEMLSPNLFNSLKNPYLKVSNPSLSKTSPSCKA